MTQETSLHHAAITGEDKEKTILFFTTILRIPLEKTSNFSKELSDKIFSLPETCEMLIFANQQTRFEVFLNEKPFDHGYAHICLVVDSLAELFSRCSTYGITPLKIQKNGKNIYFIKDFSGNIYEIKEHPS